MTALEATRAALSASVRSRTFADGELVTLPLATSARNLIQLYVEQVQQDRWLVSDLGLAAGELATAGVDLNSRKVARQSWGFLLAQMGLEAPVMHDVGDYHIAGIAVGSQLGPAILSVGQTVVRADMLRVLAPGFRAQRFSEVILAAAGAREVPFTPNAPMPTKHGGSRQVTVRIEGSRRIYMQGVSARNSPIDGYDKAQSVFASAEVEKDDRVAVVADALKLDRWQWETLEDTGVPLHERDLDAFLSNVA